MTDTTTRSSITLKGSAQMVKEFFDYGINSILFQRGIYPPEMFVKEKKYNMALMVTKDEKLRNYLNPLLKQVEYWLSMKRVKRLVLVIQDVKTKEVLERWEFNIETDESFGEGQAKEVCEKRIKQEISDVLKQIVSCVSFLPIIEVDCSFDVLIFGKHLENDENLPDDWADSTARNIVDAEEVDLRQFSTNVHKVATKVQYKADC
ncbi:unnamed protein product [Bursaphelenchus okinawaensis]|uniref:Mitotic spindle assembly checkpoint protein MAD2A n=1 Tax=Bursaphelenchus okinawaensis TaxID=465554 RepID=A0A811KRS8_9BILA|nr:unnamed protein product [Bursaphelenchus okinawaensis]CAG9110379.1 unnamed protein product [Bursaphelenchus okinawaensis]